MWFDGNRILTYNCLFNFIVGNRGCGKTYWFKKWAVSDFLKNKNQFVYIRRYRTEVNVSNFFEQIVPEFPDVEFKVNGKSFYINGEYAGCAIALSTAITKKSMVFSKVNKICYDEFIIEQGNYRYINDEPRKFLDMYETINRLRIDQPEVTVFFLSNAISQYNPYFIEFGIQFRNSKYRKGEIYAELIYDPEFVAAKKNTRFGKIINGTSYEDYAVNNNFYLDDDSFIEKKSGLCSYCFTIDYADKLYGVWINYKKGKYYISHDVDASCKKIYAFTTDDHKPNTLMIKAARSSPAIKGLVDNYKLGNVWYESGEIKNSLMDLYKTILF